MKTLFSKFSNYKTIDIVFTILYLVLALLYIILREQNILKTSAEINLVVLLSFIAAAYIYRHIRHNFTK